jgi:hypothetical protein
MDEKITTTEIKRCVFSEGILLSASELYKGYNGERNRPVTGIRTASNNLESAT